MVIGRMGSGDAPKRHPLAASGLGPCDEAGASEGHAWTAGSRDANFPSPLSGMSSRCVARVAAT
jgi:hypothetical protein